MATPALSLQHVSEFAADVRESLTKPGQRELPSKYLYDEVGSALFEAICVLPEYGLTRADTRLLKEYSAEIVSRQFEFARTHQPRARCRFRLGLLPPRGALELRGPPHRNAFALDVPAERAHSRGQLAYRSQRGRNDLDRKFPQIQSRRSP